MVQGLVINGKKEHLLHNDFGSKDVYYHYTNVSADSMLLHQALGHILQACIKSSADD